MSQFIIISSLKLQLWAASIGQKSDQSSLKVCILYTLKSNYLGLVLKLGGRWVRKLGTFWCVAAYFLWNNDFFCLDLHISNSAGQLRKIMCESNHNRTLICDAVEVISLEPLLRNLKTRAFEQIFFN